MPSHRLLSPAALVYLYRRRLRVHLVPELLAGAGVAVGVALVMATLVAAASVAGSATEVLRAVVGPATLQLHARSGEGFGEGMLRHVERLPGVKRAAPLLEQTATIETARGRRVTVDLAGADTSLVVMDGLAHTLPRSTLTSGGVGLSAQTAKELGIAASTRGQTVTLTVRGRAYPIGVSAVLDRRRFGALAQATVAVLPLAHLQTLAGLRGRVTRILIQPLPGRERVVRAELSALAGGRIDAEAADADVGLLRQALRPSDQASALFATLSGLLGLLFAVNALLLTVPDRRRAIADLCLIGAKPAAIVQMVAFQALCLGVGASLVGLALGYALSLGALHQSTGYLSEAFTIGAHTIVGLKPVAIAFAGGVLTTCVASGLPLLDLRRGRAIEVVYGGEGAPGNAPPAATRRLLGLAGAGLLTATTALFALAPQQALLACALLALAAVLLTPLAFAGVLRAGEALSGRWEKLTVLRVALTSLRSTRLRSLALAATGAVALFGSVALGGARGDLLRGIEGFAGSYASDAEVWVGSPGDNQAVVGFRANGVAARVARVPGVASAEAFQGGFMELHGRRVWLIARPPGAADRVLAGQIEQGNAATAERRLAEGGWVTLSAQLAKEAKTGVGGTIALPTPHGWQSFRVAATTTNLAWSPGTIFLAMGDYERLWGTTQPTALGVRLAAGTDVARTQHAITAAVGTAAASPRATVAASPPRGAAAGALVAGSGLEVVSAGARRAQIDTLTSEGLGQLGEISMLLLAAAIVAMAAALLSSIWQRRRSLAALRLSGIPPRRLRMILLCESFLMLGAGCLTGALAGIYGQVIIDGYLEHVTGFPVANLGATLRPVEILALVVAAVLALVTIPGWRASNVAPALAFNE